MVPAQDPGPEKTDGNIGKSGKENVNSLVRLSEMRHHRSVLGFVGNVRRTHGWRTHGIVEEDALPAQETERK